METAANDHRRPDPDGSTSVARVKVRIGGDEYILRGSASPEHLQRLGAELDRRLTEVIRKYPRLLLHQAAVLCALQILEELERARAENRELLQLFEDVR